LLEVGRDSLVGGLEKTAQFRLDVKLPFGTGLSFARRGWPAKEPVLRGRGAFRFGTCRNLTQKLG